MTGVEIRLPELQGGTEAEQLHRIQNYLYNLAQQLQYAFDNTAQAAVSLAPAAANTLAESKTAEASAIKSLILRSAEIMERVSQEVSGRLSGRYVAQSQFGTFTQQTDQKITASAEALRQEFSNMQQIETDLQGVRDSLLEVSASIRTGLLYEDGSGVPVYGVEIGQQTREDGVICFRKFARLTAERLSFYDNNDVEVAYISDRQLHITAADVAQITASDAAITRLTMGPYTWQSTPDGHLSII